MAEELGLLQDADLVQLARGGNRIAFEQLVNRHYRRCLALATLILRNPTDAQDQAQNACVKAFDRLDQYKGTADFCYWLSRIVETECLMVLRSRRRVNFVYIDSDCQDQEVAPMELPAQSPDPEYDLLNRQFMDVIRREMNRLPRLMRQVIVLRYIQELPVRDIATRLGVSEAAAKSRLSRAREELRLRTLPHCDSRGTYTAVVRNPPATALYKVAQVA